jgi:hypothetical protein
VQAEPGGGQPAARIRSTSHRRAGNAFVFEEKSADGTVTLSTPLGSRGYDMEDVGSALAPTGTATITCRPGGAEFVSESVTMDLRRR